MQAEFLDEGRKKGADILLLMLRPTRSDRLPHLAEISIGRVVLISADDGKVDIERAEYTISGEVCVCMCVCVCVYVFVCLCHTHMPARALLSSHG